jgi:hypothetical protein
MKKGMAVALLQCGIVLSMAGKYAMDRDRLPRVWVNCTPVDPNLPVRGRYLSLRLQVDAPEKMTAGFAKLSIQNGRLSATPAGGGVVIFRAPGAGASIAEAVPFFISEHAKDPSLVRKPHEELWVEVSVPTEGVPRPLRLGIKKDGVITPLP